MKVIARSKFTYFRTLRFKNQSQIREHQLHVFFYLLHVPSLLLLISYGFRDGNRRKLGASAHCPASPRIQRSRISISIHQCQSCNLLIQSPGLEPPTPQCCKLRNLKRLQAVHLEFQCCVCGQRTAAFTNPDSELLRMEERCYLCEYPFDGSHSEVWNVCYYADGHVIGSVERPGKGFESVGDLKEWVRRRNRKIRLENCGK